MSTDAHAFLQYRERDRDSWYVLAQDVNITADYLLFAILARVRLHNFTDAVIRHIAKRCPEPKGLPDDWIESMKDDATHDDPLRAWVRGWYGVDGKHADGHSFTWLTYEELAQAGHTYFMAMTMLGDDDHVTQCAPPRPMINRDLEALLRYMGVYVNGGCSVRLVAWFDN